MHTFSRGCPSRKRLIFTIIAILIPLIVLPAIQVLAGPLLTLRAASSQGTHLGKTAIVSTHNGCATWHVVLSGETLSGIAYSHGTDWSTLATVNHLANPNQLLAGQTLCLSVGGTVPNNGGIVQNMTRNMIGAVGNANPFPYGQCTWWAAQKYYQIHKVYVPWSTNANAWQWADRAREYGWQVSDQPSVGAIIDLQPYVQGASGLGHVGFVERVQQSPNPNGGVQVSTSNINWGADPSTETDVNFTPGPGVSFISRFDDIPLA